MPGGAAAPLHQPAFDGEARFAAHVDPGQNRGHFLTGKQFGVDAIQAQCIAAPCIGIHLRQRVADVQDAALREHDIVVEFVGKRFPHLHREFVEVLVFRQQIVGPDGRRIAPDIAGTEQPFFDYCDVSDAEFLGKIVGRRQPMPAAADDDHIIFRFWLGFTPRGFPAGVAGQRMFHKAEDRVFGHGQFLLTH